MTLTDKALLVLQRRKAIKSHQLRKELGLADWDTTGNAILNVLTRRGIVRKTGDKRPFTWELI